MERILKTAIECKRNADRCERMARDTLQASYRLTLMATAHQWRTLADHASAREAIELRRLAVNDREPAKPT